MMETQQLYQVAEQALGLWGLQGSALNLVAQRENAVFEVQAKDARYALRLHRPGYQTPAAMDSELAWMASIGESGVQVPAPSESQSGKLLEHFEGYYIDLLSWLTGKPMGSSVEPLQLADRYGTYRQIGELMARLHNQADTWQQPAGFQRMAWDQAGLLGEEPLWGRFWENPDLPTDLQQQMLRCRQLANDILQRESLDYGLIHADLVRENILIKGNELQLIDFDDSGFGYRLFDVATTLGKNWQEADAKQLEAAFIEGYGSVRQQDWQWLPLFTMLRALTYVGWIVPRISEPGSIERQQRFFRAAKLAMDEFEASL